MVYIIFIISRTYLSRANVSRRQYILKFIGEEELLEFIGNVDSSLRDVKISDDENKLYHVIRYLRRYLPLQA